jgi:hypothetical protein
MGVGLARQWGFGLCQIWRRVGFKVIELCIPALVTFVEILEEMSALRMVGMTTNIRTLAYFGVVAAEEAVEGGGNLFAGLFVRHVERCALRARRHYAMGSSQNYHQSLTVGIRSCRNRKFVRGKL